MFRYRKGCKEQLSNLPKITPLRSGRELKPRKHVSSLLCWCRRQAPARLGCFSSANCSLPLSVHALWPHLPQKRFSKLSFQSPASWLLLPCISSEHSRECLLQIPALCLPLLTYGAAHHQSYLNPRLQGSVVWQVGNWGPEIVLKFIFSKSPESIFLKKTSLIHCDLYVSRPTLLYSLVGKHLGCLLWPLFTVLKHPCFRPALSSASFLPYLMLTCLFEIGHMLILTRR